MKNLCLGLCFLALALPRLYSQVISPSDPANNTATAVLPLDPLPTVPSAPSLVESGANHQVWRTSSIHTNRAGRMITQTTGSYTELATSKNHLVGGQWVRSSDEISLTENGALAANSAHRVAFPASADSAVQLTLPSGEILTSHV